MGLPACVPFPDIGFLPLGRNPVPSQNRVPLSKRCWNSETDRTRPEVWMSIEGLT